jgi:hypothetical protein
LNASIVNITVTRVADANLPFDAELSDIKISLRIEKRARSYALSRCNVLWFKDGSGISVGS